MEDLHWLDDESETEEEAAERKSRQQAEARTQSEGEEPRTTLLRRLIGSESSQRDERDRQAEAKDEPEASSESPEARTPVDELEPDEEQFVAEQLVDAIQRQEEQEPTTADNPNEAVADDAVNYFRSQILGAETPSEALADTLHVIEGDDASDGGEPLTIPEEGTVEMPLSDGDEASPLEHPGMIPPELLTTINHSPSEEAALGSDEVGSGLGGPPGAGTVRSGRVGGPGGPSLPDFQPNVLPSPGHRGAKIATERQPDYEVSTAGPVLIGGIIGYLIGRRRGRIKTEKRLLPVQKKLEKRVENLRQDLAAKEAVIRRVALERSYEQGAQDKLALRLKKLTEARPQPKPVSLVAEAATWATERGKHAEAKHNRNPVPLEHLGQALIVATEVGGSHTANIKRSPAEAVPSKRPAEVVLPEQERSKPRIETAEPLPIDKHVETLSQNDLLELSSKIVLDGSSLRQTYEAHLIGEKGLRRLVSEHLRGGNVKRELRRELVQREIDFERDPALRDRGRQKRGSDGGRALRQMLQQAGAPLDEDYDHGARGREVLAMSESRAAYEAKQADRQRRVRRAADTTLVTIIMILLALVAYMYFQRRG